MWGCHGGCRYRSALLEHTGSSLDGRKSGGCPGADVLWSSLALEQSLSAAGNAVGFESLSAAGNAVGFESGGRWRGVNKKAEQHLKYL